MWLVCDNEAEGVLVRPSINAQQESDNLHVCSCGRCFLRGSWHGLMDDDCIPFSAIQFHRIGLLCLAVGIPLAVAAAGGIAATVAGVASAAANAAPISPPSSSGVLSVTPLPAATPVTAAVAAALGSAILAGDINAAAQVFIDSDDIAGLVLGLQIPPGVSGAPSGDRNSNGDVVAIKAVALAVLSAPGLEGKLTEVLFRAAILPSQEAGTAGLTLEVESTIDNIFANLSNVDLLQRILNGNANTTFRKRLRQLLCVDCSDSRSWVCSACWPAEFCVAFWFCEDLINGPRLVPSSSFEVTTTPL
ncbi:unnamed protein product [Ostreobium quekettii]|uniref:Uncharacterized protein n=1 Tax=Ostreobium quekettii TaxID=121088 RepID=A0A8S1IWM2_9CHLO|nr:unnamed protein product [Ostreobium quekettii]